MSKNLTKEQIDELNSLLSNPTIDIPPFRREVHITGGNYTWLKNHIQKRNNNLCPRLKELLDLA